MTDAQKSLRDVFRNLLQGVGNAASVVNDPRYYLREGRQPPTAPQQQPDESRAAQEASLAKVAKYKAEFDGRVNDAAQQFAEGKLTGAQFRGDMLREIRFYLLMAAASGAGGIGYLNPPDFQRIDAEVRHQAAYLDNWIAQVERQSVEKRSVAQMQMRARMYGGAAGSMAQETMDKVQFREFPDLPFYPKKKTLCKSNCKCRWEWRNVDRETGSAEAWYLMGHAEHCETCINRAAVFKPLRCVKFEWVNMPTDLSPFFAE